MAKRKRIDRPKKNSPLSVKKRDAEQIELVSALDLLRQRRGPYSELLTGIVTDTLEQFAPVPGKPIVEIGAGGGQLRDWLPPNLRARILHTDPSPATLRMLVERSPEAHTAVARAEHLPIDAGTCGAVLGLCVFDAITGSAQMEAIKEIARVLCPGGRFMHFLDMATLLDAPFEKLAASGLVPIPNVFGDPADHDWPLDIVLLKRDWLTGLLDFAARTGHPLAATFADYFAAFLSVDPRFDVEEATRLFKAVASNGEAREALSTLLGSACRLSFQWGYPAMEPLPFHSGKYLASVLETSFRQSGAFRVLLCEIRTKAAWRPALLDDTTRYRSLCVGHQRIMDQIPHRLLATSETAARPPPPDEVLVEVGVFAFVAEVV